jgi:hypothetical protein
VQTILSNNVLWNIDQPRPRRQTTQWKRVIVVGYRGISPNSAQYIVIDPDELNVEPDYYGACNLKDIWYHDQPYPKTPSLRPVKIKVTRDQEAQAQLGIDNSPFAIACDSAHLSVTSTERTALKNILAALGEACSNAGVPVVSVDCGEYIDPEEDRRHMTISVKVDSNADHALRIWDSLAQELHNWFREQESLDLEEIESDLSVSVEWAR